MLPMLPGSQAGPASEAARQLSAGGGRRRVTRPGPWTELMRPDRVTAFLELGLTLSGVALSLFMMMHLGLLFSVLLGASRMDSLAGFLEKYYLLHIGAVFLIIFLVGHIFLATRKVPTSFGRQWAVARHTRSLGHLDTWTWAFQILSGVALLALIAIHLWVILTDLPVESDKSGVRVFDIYLWLYVPFVLLVESHMSIGIYRAAMKWGLMSRRLAHGILSVWTALVLSLGFAILIALYRIGGDV